jgi:coproporphyrinogen III oxidase-like Fe-S oxidoreductase
MIRGIDLREFQRRYGISINSLAEDAIARHSRNGLLEYNDQTLKLTQDGLLLADTVISDFL